MRTRQLVRDLIRKTPSPERRYINDRGTLITLAVRAHHDGLRDERVRRARESLRHGPILNHGNADKEFNEAIRVVASRNKRGEVCVVHVSPVKMPRRWPNALPGGTSPRRALRAIAIAEAEVIRDIRKAYKPGLTIGPL